LEHRPHTATSWWKYNPILTKPTSLEAIKPWSWFYFYGPDPAAGVSYGQYHDKDTKQHLVTEKMNVVYSPTTGVPLEYVCDVPSSEVESAYKVSKASKMAVGSFVCKKCGYKCSTINSKSQKHCTKCGALQEDSMDKNLKAKVKAKLQARASEKDMWVPLDEVIKEMKAEGDLFIGEEPKKEPALDEECEECDEDEVEELEDEECEEECEEEDKKEVTSDTDMISIDELMGIIESRRSDKGEGEEVRKV